MAIEISEEKKGFSFGWIFQLLFALSILVFLAAAGGFIYYQFVRVQPNVVQSAQLKADILNSKPEKEASIENEAAFIQSYLNDYLILYNGRAQFSKFFSNTNGKGFENWVHPSVYFTNFSINADSRTVNLSGVSNDFKPLIEQLRILKSIRDTGKGIEQYQVSDIKLAEQGGVSFSLVITVTPETIKFDQLK